MRSAWSCMIAEESVARGRVVLAGPCRVSMKPAREASGVRSSWLALATKSTRTRSVCRRSVRSSRMNRTSPAAGDGISSRANQAAYQRSAGTRST